jgi:hypothetical protein
MNDASTRTDAKDHAGDLAERYSGLWESGQAPDLDFFLEKTQPISPADLAAILRVDQRERWRLGTPVPAEDYLTRYPAATESPDAALDLIYGEFLLRERRGEEMHVDSFLKRFPEHAAALRDQIELHRALEAPDAGELSWPPAHGTADTLRPPVPAGDSALTFQERRSAPQPLPEVFGRYRIVRPLAQGGMGAVYLAHDTQLERDVALKVPRLGHDADEGAIARFYREARIAATFVHPHLCPVYEVGQIDGIHYLTMPYLQGETLADWLKRAGPLSVDEALRFCILIARAVHDAHQAGVLHRDLKPANIMVSVRREPIVMDFGLARRGAVRDPRVTASHIILGTPVYSAPEQMGGDADALGPACDVYSLGVILYEMLTGKPPFKGAVHEVLRQVLVCAPDPPTLARPELAPGVAAVCLRALAKEPEQRFATMEEFAAALETCLGGTAAPALIQPARRAAPRGRLSSRRLPILLVVTGLLLAVAAAWLGWHHFHGSRATEPDPFHAGAHWTGRFQFKPPLAPTTGDVSLRIAKRTGNRLWGEYATEGQHRWEIEGETVDDTVSWTLMRYLGEFDPVEGVARVRGTFHGKTLTAVFRDKNSEAEIVLFKEEPGP